MLIPVDLRGQVINKPILVIVEVLLVRALPIVPLLPHGLFLLSLPLQLLLCLELFIPFLLLLLELSLALVLHLEGLALTAIRMHVFVLETHIVLASGTSLGFTATVRCMLLILLKLDDLVAEFAGFWLERAIPLMLLMIFLAEF